MGINSRIIGIFTYGIFTYLTILHNTITEVSCQTESHLMVIFYRQPTWTSSSLITYKLSSNSTIYFTFILTITLLIHNNNYLLTEHLIIIVY